VARRRSVQAVVDDRGLLAEAYASFNVAREGGEDELMLHLSRLSSSAVAAADGVRASAVSTAGGFLLAAILYRKL
jgi:hypothetical protein